MKLFMTPAVQSYLNGIPAKDLNGDDRAIYRHGTLRKVCGFVRVSGLCGYRVCVVISLILLLFDFS